MKILLVEDNISLRKGIRAFLENQDYIVTEASNGKEALKKILDNNPNIIITDVRMPEMGGLELLENLKNKKLDLPVIMITAHASVKDAVQAVKNGAEDYLTKPLNLEELGIKIQKVKDRITLISENKDLKEKLNRLEFPEMIGNSKIMQELQKMINKVAVDPDIPIMIYGESGTGKELVARAIQSRSQRSSKPFITVNCAAFPDNLLESELFGYKRGAFTGAYKDKSGYFQAAEQGTLFLDEVSEMSPGMQVKLLRVLQEGQIQPVGGLKLIKTNVRIIGASNKKLSQLVDEGKFRDDLYYRLNVVEIKVPPLRNRPEDIPLLIKYFDEMYRSNSKKNLSFSQDAINSLQNYSWPGNVRELENLLRRIQVTCNTDVIEISDLPNKIISESYDRNLATGTTEVYDEYKLALENTIQNFEIKFLTYHLQKNNGNISKTANSIGLSRVALHKKIKHLGIGDG